MKRTLMMLGLGAVLMFPVAVWSGPDAAQQQLIQQTQQAKMKMQEAERAKEAERVKLLGEHMKMMEAIIGKMNAMKPRPSMSMKEHEEWIAENQKLMETVMGQMMQEHHMLMKMSCK
jgi:hypothetical protein